MAKYISRAAIAAAALALGVSGAYAGQYGDPSNLSVSVNVATSCSISSVAPIAFSQISAGAMTTEEVKPSAIVVNCNSGGWHLSVAADVDNDVRSMTNGSASLHYKLCNPTPGSYASCTPFNQGHPISGTALTDTQTIYGVMEGGVLPAKSGTYSDTVQIQLTN
jgi:spore coat protein U-like protein